MRSQVRLTASSKSKYLHSADTSPCTPRPLIAVRNSKRSTGEPCLTNSRTTTTNTSALLACMKTPTAVNNCITTLNNEHKKVDINDEYCISTHDCRGNYLRIHRRA